MDEVDDLTVLLKQITPPELAKIIECESGWQMVQNAQGSSAFGYGQVLKSTAKWVSEKTGIPDNRHDPLINWMMSMYLYTQNGGQDWYPSYKCHGIM